MKTKKSKKRIAAVLPWPGPTRLYDPQVDAGAVLLTGEQARALVATVGAALEIIGGPPKSVERHLFAAVEALNVTFGMGIGEDDEPRHAPGTVVRWGGERWKVVEWQPHNGIGGSYWLRNAKGESGVAGHDEVKVVKRRAAR